MRSISFEGDTWQRYETLRAENKPLHQIRCRILKEMQRGNPADGTGKPEALRHGLSGLWSRRLSQIRQRTDLYFRHWWTLPRPLICYRSQVKLGNDGKYKAELNEIRQAGQ